MSRDWDQNTVDRHINFLPSQQSKNIFHDTHYPIDRVYANYIRSPVRYDEFLTQENILESITSSKLTNDNRLFIIEGASGCGKTQLCTWLSHQLGRELESGQVDSYIALHHSQRDHSEDFFDILTEYVEIDNQVINIVELDSEKAAKALVANIRVFGDNLREFSEAEVQSLTESRQERVDLQDILANNLREYQAKYENDVDTHLELVSRDEYQLLTTEAFNNDPDWSRLDHLRSAIKEHLTGILGVESVSEKLASISEAYVEKGYRPVILCDDLPTLGVLQEQFLNYAIQPQKGHYDIVVGWSPSWYNHHVGPHTDGYYAYIKNKAEGYLRLSTEGQPYFFTEETVVPFSKKYMRSIRSASDIEFDREIPTACFDGLYPFSPAFVRRLYSKLKQDGVQTQTPRLFLRAIRDCLLAQNPPFETVEQATYVESVTMPTLLSYPPDLLSLLRWYGQYQSGRVIIPANLFEAFDLDIPPRMAQDEMVELTE